MSGIDSGAGDDDLDEDWADDDGDDLDEPIDAVVGETVRLLVHRDAVLADRHREVAATRGPELLAAARAHRVSGLLAAGLTRQDVVLDAETAAEFDEDRREQATEHVVRAREVARLAAALDIDWVVAKGPALSSGWYADAGSRAYTDIDLLVRPSDFGRALDRLYGLGYTDLATNWRGFRVHRVAEVPLERGDSTVDLHWDLVGLGRHRRDLRLLTDEVIDRSVVIEVGGASVRTPAAEDTLLHLCVHAGLAGARRLLHLADVDVVVRRADLDWTAFVARARAAGAAALALAVLQRAVAALDTPVPGHVLDALAPHRGLRPVLRGLDSVHHDGATGMGVHVAGVRDTLAATIRASAYSLGEAVGPGLGRTAPTEDPDRISWIGPPRTDDELVSDRDEYVSAVPAMAGRYVVRRTRDASRVAALGGGRPDTTIPVAHAVSADRLGGRTRAWIVRDDDGQAVGAFVLVFYTPVLSVGYPLIVDERAAAALADLIERLAVVYLVGFARHVRPLAPHLSRWDAEIETKGGWVAAEHIPDMDPPRSRVAGPGDEELLVRLLRAMGMPRFRVPGVARVFARLAIDRGASLLLEDGDAIGYATVEASTGEFDVLGTIGIRPDRRGRGLAWDLIRRLAVHARENGRGVLALAQGSNPMSIPEGVAIDADGMVVELLPPRRFRGERRLWWLAWDLFE